MKIEVEVPQEPVLKIGTEVTVGYWEGKAEAIERERVIIRLNNGKRFPVGLSLIECGGRK
jgi:hypothetical protein